MQIKAVRSDLQIIAVSGDVQSRLEQLDRLELDAVLVPWASLRRLSISPRYYVSLQPDQMTPAASQGTIGVICRADSTDLIAKLRYIEDSEASWSARCERAFMAKMGATRDSPVGVYAHRKGTQDPWILDAVIGDSVKGELLRHREIGTSRCKPESLADKAFVGIISKGARKFLPFS
jgi:hydroxymethylbilane synthase